MYVFAMNRSPESVLGASVRIFVSWCSREEFKLIFDFWCDCILMKYLKSPLVAFVHGKGPYQADAFPSNRVIPVEDRRGEGFGRGINSLRRHTFTPRLRPEDSPPPNWSSFFVSRITSTSFPVCTQNVIFFSKVSLSNKPRTVLRGQAITFRDADKNR